MGSTSIAPNSSCCRLCLRTDSIMYSIFEENAMELIFSCVSVKVLKNDKITTDICVICLQKIKSWDSFKQQCIKSQMMLNNLPNRDENGSEEISDIILPEDNFSNVEFVDEKELAKVTISKQRSNSDADSELDERSVSPRSYTSEDYYAMLETEDDTDSIISDESNTNSSARIYNYSYQCEYCCNIYERRDLLLEHLHSCKVYTSFQIPTNPDQCKDLELNKGLIIDGNLLACFKNSELAFLKQFWPLINMLQILCCEFCEQHYSTKGVLLGHVKNYHIAVPLWSCFECFAYFPNRKEFAVHMRTCTCLHRRWLVLNKKFACKVCEEMFYELKTFKTHLYEKHVTFSNSRLTCNACKCTLCNLRDCNFHLLSRGCFLLLFCNVCKKYFNTGVEFNVHSCFWSPQKNYASRSFYMNSMQKLKRERKQLYCSSDLTTSNFALDKFQPNIKQNFIKNRSCGGEQDINEERFDNVIKITLHKCTYCLNSYSKSYLKKHMMFSCKVKPNTLVLKKNYIDKNVNTRHSLRLKNKFY